MKSALLSGAMAVLCVAGAYAQDSDSNKWAPAEIKIDGKATEWPKPLQFYNNDTKLFYTIANDAEQLYVIVSVPDQQSQMKIMRSGLTFSINPGGKKKATSSITFPLCGDAAAPDAQESQLQRSAGEWKKAILANVKEINVEGIAGVQDGNIPVQNSYGIRTAASVDDANNLVCELAIPLKLVGLSASSDQPVAYRFRVNALTREDRKAKEKEAKDRAAAAKDKDKGNGGGMHGGGIYGQQMGGQPMENLFFSKDFWTKQTMAKHQ
ncbi:hypothetical protein [Chitinophaga vietnamensis]|uniref:hypothetical protein n=1 Tax=Chitinophaga vietnamensis TaxID=2593957 RepID=UPI001177568C|nr:hypothetical protein [Chitinophaga vietnamensis]